MPQHNFYHLMKILMTLGLLFWGIPGLQSQVAEVEWLKKNTSNKSFRTVSLLSAGPSGFTILRAKTEPGQPEIPYITQMDPTGGMLHNDPLPGFENNPKLSFRFALESAGNLLVCYAQTDATAGTQRICIRTFDTRQRKWAGAEQDIFSPVSQNASNGIAIGFRVSEHGNYTGIYRMSAENGIYQADIAVFDAGLKLAWQKKVALPKQEGSTVPVQFFCSDKGDMFIHARQYSGGASITLRRGNQLSMACHANGHPVYQNEISAEGDAPAGSNVVFLVKSSSTEPHVFFPEMAVKYTASFEFGEDNAGKIICVGIGSDEQPGETEKYYVYQIDPAVLKGETLKINKISQNFRGAFMNENAASKKRPVEDIVIRNIKITPDGLTWVLAEQEINTGTSARIGPAALVKLDSTYRMGATVVIDKNMNLKNGELRCFAPAAICPADKTGWWMFWHETNWPEMRLMLTPSKGKESFELSTASRNETAMLTNTLRQWGSNWYFVAENEDGKVFRLGKISGVKKK